MPADRRKIPRVPVFFILENIQRKVPGDKTFPGVVKNITPDGLLLETSAALKKFDALQLQLTLPTTHKTLNLEGKVCWCENQSGFLTAGLEFLDLSAEHRETIMEYLVSLGPHVE